MKLVNIATSDLKEFTIKGLNDDILWTTKTSSLYTLMNLLDSNKFTRDVILKLMDLKETVNNFKFVVKQHTECFTLGSVGLIDEFDNVYLLNGDILDYENCTDFEICIILQLNI